jgi:tryptophan-rich sensory protein
MENTIIKPEIYQWSGITVSGILAISAFCLLFFGGGDWYSNLNRSEIALPLIALAPIQAGALFASGFGVRIVMGNVSGNPAVKPARKIYGIWLVIHAIWILIFGGLHLPVLSLGIGFIQWGVATLCIQKFFNVDPKAGWKVVPLYEMTTYWIYNNAVIISLNNL